MKKLLAVLLSALLVSVPVLPVRAEPVRTVYVTLTPAAAKTAEEKIEAAAPKDFGDPAPAQVCFYTAEDARVVGKDFSVCLLLRYEGLGTYAGIDKRLKALPFVSDVSVIVPEPAVGEGPDAFLAIVRLTPEVSASLQPFSPEDFGLPALGEVSLFEAVNGAVYGEEVGAVLSLRFSGLRPDELPSLLETLRALPFVQNAETMADVLITLTPEASRADNTVTAADFGIEEIWYVEPLWTSTGNEKEGFCAIYGLHLSDESEETVKRVIAQVTSLPFVRSASKNDWMVLLTPTPVADARLILRAAVGLERLGRGTSGA